MDERVIVYGTDWCSDTVRALRHLHKKGIDYRYINIDDDESAEKKVIEFNKGKRRVPLVEVATDDGTKSLSVPSASELDSVLG